MEVFTVDKKATPMTDTVREALRGDDFAEVIAAFLDRLIELGPDAAMEEDGWESVPQLFLEHLRDRLQTIAKEK